MNLILQIVNQHGETLECSERCQYAQHDRCHCICGGTLHRKGYVLQRLFKNEKLNSHAISIIEVKAQEALEKKAFEIFGKKNKVKITKGIMRIKGSNPNQLTFFQEEVDV